MKDYTILIADDEVTNLDSLGGILSPSYNILFAKNGQRTLDLAREQKPDLILLDILMPGMSGFEVIMKLKESDITYHIPVIFITGLTDTANEEKGFDLGAVDYIVKPFNEAVVKARINTHIKIVEQMRSMERIGLIDMLTKISNRRGFEKRLNAEWGRAHREKKPISILMMDIDKFKDYNDTYGHHQGDEALKAFAGVALQALKRSADFAARWGGEEFVMLLPGTDSEGAAGVAERVRQGAGALVIPAENGDRTGITVSIGVHTAIPSSETLADDFHKKADRALYTAKESGRNRFVVYKD